MKIKNIILLVVTLIFLSLLSSCFNNEEQRSQEENYDKYKDQLVTESNSVVSPSGKYTLEMVTATIDNAYSASFRIKNATDGTIVYECGDYYALRHTTFILWGENETVWLYSGDLGTFYWKKDADNWTKKSYADNKDDVEVPEVLKELRPQYFD